MQEKAPAPTGGSLGMGSLLKFAYSGFSTVYFSSVRTCGRVQMEEVALLQAVQRIHGLRLPVSDQVMSLIGTLNVALSAVQASAVKAPLGVYGLHPSVLLSD